MSRTISLSPLQLCQLPLTSQSSPIGFCALKATVASQRCSSTDLEVFHCAEKKGDPLVASDFVNRHPGAFALGQSIFELAQGCYAYEALSLVANDPRAEVIVPDVPAGEGPQGKLVRIDGTSHIFDIRHYLSLARNHSFTNENIARSWYSGALITAGDLLADHSYFDRQPEFELVYHLRNGAAHGNNFNITSTGQRRLHSKNAYLRWYDNSKRFEITPALNKTQILFDFVGPGDVADILTLTAERLRDLE
jgi:hypothetical protein